ncbi:MAG: hypothetical protein HUK26_05800, partial [Duodenibacillus sp.]|nr:hypothetical protein [Duodenibacillus sp.]
MKEKDAMTVMYEGGMQALYNDRDGIAKRTLQIKNVLAHILTGATLGVRGQIVL